MNISTVPHRIDREAIGGLKGSNFASATGNVVCDDCRAWRHSSGPVVRENGPDRAHVHLPDSGAEPPKLGGGIGVMYIRAGKRVASYIGAVVANAVGAIVGFACGQHFCCPEAGDLGRLSVGVFSGRDRADGAAAPSE